jgi:hypothetical protein
MRHASWCWDVALKQQLIYIHMVLLLYPFYCCGASCLQSIMEPTLVASVNCCHLVVVSWNMGIFVATLAMVNLTFTLNYRSVVLCSLMA